MSEFKVGDIVVCIETGLALLTYGKEYVVVEVDGEYISVVDDSDVLAKFYSYRFGHVKQQITLEQHIKEFLNKLEYVVINDNTIRGIDILDKNVALLGNDVNLIGYDDIYTYVNASYDQLTSQAAQKRKYELEYKRLKVLEELSVIDEELGRI